MHLLAATEAPRHDAETAVDLGQSPGDIVVLSAADTELACLAAARHRLPEDAPSLRLASLMQLGHPLSVDLYLERTVARARLVVIRLLGGVGYWRYGLEQAAALARAGGIALAVLPGDARADPTLDGWSTVDPVARDNLWRYLVAGGVENGAGFLSYAAHLLGRGEVPAPPRPLPSAGLYRAHDAVVDLATLASDRRPLGLVVFYRALYQAADLAAIDALLAALEERGLTAVGLWLTSLKDAAAADVVRTILAAAPPAVILTTIAFAAASPDADAAAASPLAAADCPVFQVVLCGEDEAQWRSTTRGLSPRDLAMNVALPEVDGRILTRAIAFKEPGELDTLTLHRRTVFRPLADRVAFVAELAAAWTRLGRTPAGQRRIALVLANYPARDGRLANGVGLDTPASCIEVLRALGHAGYGLDQPPQDADALMAGLRAGPTNELRDRDRRAIRVGLPLTHYQRWLAAIPAAVRAQLLERWGPPEHDPHVVGDRFALSILPLGNVVVGLQPARGYHIDPDSTYHSPDLVPPHGYLAFHVWLREVLGAHAIVQLGKHGNLEWLPGKALALSSACWPEIALGPLPLLYPFIVNDPGEGAQAKRRAAGVIVDHLTPPLTTAGSHGELVGLERLLDEYAEATRLDPGRAATLRRDILEAASRLGLARDLALEREDDPLQHLDTHLCEIKELQIRDGLHVFGCSPQGGLLTDLLLALLRLPRGTGGQAEASLPRALALDLGLDAFDPLTVEPGTAWPGPRPSCLLELTPDAWRTAGDTIERLDLLARALLAGERSPASDWRRTCAVLDIAAPRLHAAVASSGGREIAALLAGLDGRFVVPGPSGAPTRGRPEVLPTGRNFYSVDTRAVPTAAAWRLGWASAQNLIAHHLELHGDYPRRLALSAWGTACMRTGGDDVAQALALLGCRPVWEGTTGRVAGVEVLPLELLDRPRVDVTLRLSGLFRDAFPHQVELLDDAVRAVASLDEPPEQNPLAAAAGEETRDLLAAGMDEATARRRATLRLFSSPPGAYGAGLQALIDQRGWSGDADLAAAFVAWGGYAYGRGLDGAPATETLVERLGRVELVLHNQDNREHDLLDSDDYYQFEGGLAVAVRQASGRQPEIFHQDHSRPGRPRTRRLAEEIGLIVRGRATNPRWIKGVMRHGYKGAFEIAATVDYLFAFAATAKVVEDHHFAALFDAYLGDEEVREFIARANPAALREIADRFAEAIARDLWRPSRNSAGELLRDLRGLS